MGDERERKEQQHPVRSGADERRAQREQQERAGEEVGRDVAQRESRPASEHGDRCRLDRHEHEDRVDQPAELLGDAPTLLQGGAVLLGGSRLSQGEVDGRL